MTSHSRLSASLLSAFVLAASALLSAPTTARAEGGITSVVELFTSQGCSSCPPADALLETYANRPDVLALTMPVDYWDYLGWRDTFGKSAFSQRQRLYARKRGDGRVYTPQVVVNGLTHAVGFRGAKINAAITKTSRTVNKHRFQASLKRDGKRLVIDAVATGPKAPKACKVWLVQIQSKATVNVRRGENGGNKLTYYNVVRALSPLGTWRGEPMTVTLPEPLRDKNGAVDRYAVIFQDDKVGPIIGAATIPAL
ncbi:MAG: DUF1223 domain-containing protein [Pseudomonadota bacterium]